MTINPISHHTILRPANPMFIGFSLLMALLFNVMPAERFWVLPDFLALVLVFWSIKQPRMVGMGLAWIFGILMDVHTSSVMGEHALAYTLMSYFAIALHRRVAWFSVWGQMLHILPLFLGCQLVTVAIRLLAGGMLPPWWMIFQGLATTLLWPLAVILLMAPQRRPTDRDDTRTL